MCIIQMNSDIVDFGEFEHLDEDLWLEKNGNYLRLPLPDFYNNVLRC